MGDLFNMAALTTNTFKKAIEITSHNVANVATEGYHRQQVSISSNAGQMTAGGTLGGGSKIDGVLRIYDQSIQQQLSTAYSVMSRYEEQQSLTSQVEGIVASNDEGVQQFMQRFFDAAQNLSNNPTSETSRSLLLSEGANFQSHIGNLQQVLADTTDQTNNQITDMVKEVNTRLEALQSINKEIDRANNFGLDAPNDLLDQRDQNIYELGKYIDVKSYYQQDGSVDLYTGGGNLPLLSSNTLTKIEAKYSEYSKEGRVEVYMSIGATSQKVSENFRSGSLAATIDFRNKVLDKSQDELGVTVAAMVASTNWQNYQGYDANGNPGQNIFQPMSSTTLASENNLPPQAEDGTQIFVTFDPLPDATSPKPPYASAAALDQPGTYTAKNADYQTALTAIGQMNPREYLIQSDGAGGFKFYDYLTREDITAKASPTGTAGVYQLEGLKFDMSTIRPTSDGDQFLVKPYKDMLADFNVTMKNGAEIATRGQSPNPADTAPTAAADGDNVNIANLANLASKKLMFANNSNQASETLFGGYSRMATNVGMYARGTDVQLAAQTAVYDNAKSRSEGLSGVSLDEEAANLMMYQQAYQAAAQLITSTKQMFDTLIGVMR
ncbi:flagellar hook-associated protein FlgK [Thiosulfativibrio zosterae]|uniref:Flagellar hook-associated protein 1 n=1 Tax=Thiosulfativibrio zosterae TaxID=2675053 RepID=A0A6F8PLZ0_9GAMM|nr:flagellar hook-associated protein FlgK [Thiosulfativibrio zosterae]BBP43074.1 flagellar hook protein FlgK [Thiosulfativibrio zosterae]